MLYMGQVALNGMKCIGDIYRFISGSAWPEPYIILIYGSALDDGVRNIDVINMECRVLHIPTHKTVC